MAEYTIGSICSGVGGLDLAVEDVFDAAPAWFSQYEPPDKDGRPDRHQWAAQVLAHHWPDVPNHGDLTRIDWASVAPVDILTAGFPCQNLSLAGKREGMRRGNRSGLWFHIAQAIEVLRPSLVVIENVPGILSSAADGDVEPCLWCLGDPGGEPPLRALGAVLADLARLGFDAQWTSVNASDVGAPHKRRRVFLAAWPADAPRPRLETRGQGRPRGDAAPDAAHVGHERGWPSRLGRSGSADGRLAAADPQGFGRGEGRPEPAREQWGFDAALGGGPAPADSCGIEPERRGGPRELGGQAAAEPREGDQRERAGDAPGDRGPADLDWGAYAPAIARWEHVMMRPAPAPTEPGKNGPRLSPVFVEWLMGLPLGWVTGETVEQWRARLAHRAAGLDPYPVGMRGTLRRHIPIPRNAQLKALGNGVVPQQGAAALRELLPAWEGP